MEHRTASLITLGGLAVLSVVVTISAVQVASLEGSITALLSHQLTDRQVAMQTITEDVERANGTTVTVTTTRLDGESLDDWVARHDAATAKLREE